MKNQVLGGAALQRAIGEIVRRERLARGFSQEAFAGLVGLHRTYIGSVERGERNITLQNLAVLAQAFDMQLSVFIAEAERHCAKGHKQ